MIAVVSGDLPLAPPAGTSARERADAARNRERILEAAAALVAERGIDRVAMHDVAVAAHVGTGTVYRRFGDRAGLAEALLDERTRELQDAMIAGPPPLGPGAPAADRLCAFGDAYLELLERHGDLLAAAEPSGGEGPGPLRFYLVHLTMLLREAAPHLDPEYAARALLAALAPAHHAALRRGLGWELERLRAGWHGLVGALSASAVRAPASPSAAPASGRARSTAA